MVESTADHFFASESSWPFVLREKAMADSVAFMSGEGAESKISLRIFGEAGSGKSFFVRDLICRLSEAVNPQAALYLDFPPSDLEATNVLRKIDHLIALPRHPDRSNPQFVAASLAASWNSKKRKARTWHKSYAYGVARDLSAQIPVVGPFIKAVLPPSLPLDSETGLRAVPESC